jgi:RNA polymerase sigma factor (sigma-70 family)
MTSSAAPLLLHLRRLAAPARATAPDAALLEGFAQRGDQDAFAALVARHGPMVLGVCRRVLADAQDAEDAFQATFLVLARKAAHLRQPAALAGFLHGVALRIAHKARATRRRSAPLDGYYPDPRPDPLDALSSRELLAVLDEEVRRLPETYRLPIVLCYLQGRTAAEAARLLGWTAGSVRGRLERGRARLQQRLARRGLAVPAGLVGVAAGARSATAAVPPALLDAVRRTAAAVVQGSAAPAARRVAALAAAGILTVGRLPITATLLLILGTLLAGAAAVRQQPATPQEPPKTIPALPPPPQAHVRRDLQGDPLPEGAVARLGTVRWRHSYTAGAVVFSPDGKQLATLGGFSTARPLVVWDAQTGRQRFDLPAPGSVIAAAFTPDSRALVAVTESHGVYRWDAVTGKQNSHLIDTGRCRFAALTPDARMLVTSDREKALRLFDLAAGKAVRDMALTEEGAEIWVVAVAADGKRIATAEKNGTVRLWDPRTGGTVKEWTIPHGAIQALAFSPDGASLATGAEDGTLQLWDAHSAKERWLAGFGKEGRVNAIAFAADGKALGVAAGRSVRLLDAASGKERRQWEDFPFPVLGVTFDAAGKTLAAVGSMSSVVQLYDLATGKAREDPSSHTAGLRALQFSPDGKALTSLGGDRWAFRWDLVTQRGEKLAAGTPGRVWGRALSPDGRLLAVADGLEGRVCLWDLAGGKEVAVLGKMGQVVNHLAFSPDGRKLALSVTSSSVRLWDVAGRRELRRLDGFDGNGGALAFSPDGKILAAAPWTPSPLPPVRLWDVESGKLLRRLDGPRWGCTVAFSPDGKYVAVGGLDDHERKVLVRATDGRSVWVYETATWERRWRLQGHEKGVAGLAFSPDSRLLASGGCEGDDRVCVWDLETGNELKCFRGHHSGIWPLAFSPDGRTLASGGGDSTILLWDLGRK